ILVLFRLQSPGGHLSMTVDPESPTMFSRKEILLEKNGPLWLLLSENSPSLLADSLRITNTNSESVLAMPTDKVLRWLVNILLWPDFRSIVLLLQKTPLLWMSDTNSQFSHGTDLVKMEV